MLENRRQREWGRIQRKIMRAGRDGQPVDVDAFAKRYDLYKANIGLFVATSDLKPLRAIVIEDSPSIEGIRHANRHAHMVENNIEQDSPKPKFTEDDQQVVASGFDTSWHDKVKLGALDLLQHEYRAELYRQPSRPTITKSVNVFVNGITTGVSKKIK